jgi:DNA-binding FadR family transcriptional regulator
MAIFIVGDAHPPAVDKSNHFCIKVSVMAARFEQPRTGTSEQIAFAIRRHIAEGGLEPGDRLGTEQELAGEFGVSRPTLREALRLLAGSHLVRASRGPGGGIFVAATPNEGMGRNVRETIGLMLETESVSLLELMDARIYLEVPLAGLAAEHATAETGRELRDAIDAARGNHPASDEFRIADTRFHEVIATTAQNELLRAFTSWTLEVLQPAVVETLRDAYDGDLIIAQHEAILAAVVRNRPAAAQKAMRTHLDYVRGLVEDR